MVPRIQRPRAIVALRAAKIAILSLSASVLAALVAHPAAADYKMCNATSYVLLGAIAHETSDEWQSEGWVELTPGACAPALSGNVTGGPYYVFARSIDAHQGGTKYFGGTERFCTTAADFQIEGRDGCLARGFDTQDFAAVETKSGSEWVTTFSEARDYPLARSKVAGVQRLLRDNGYKIGRIDGYGGRNTTRAIMSFQRSVNTKPDGQITDALFAALIEGAEREQSKTGLSVCNETERLIWSAVAHEAEDGVYESSGWIRIEPGQCQKAVKGKLAQRYYYLYAEAVDETDQTARGGNAGLVWGGSHKFCTKSGRFQIAGRRECADRGFDEVGFRKVDTGGAARWTEKLR